MARVNSKVRAVPVARAMLQASIAGEFFGALGAPESTIKAAQQGVLDGDLEGLSVYGLDADGDAVMDSKVRFSADGPAEVMINSAEGQSVLESFSRSMAGTVVHVANQMKAKGLRADFRFNLASNVDADPERRRSVMEKLGLSDGTAIQRKPGSTERQAANIERQDGGINLGISIWR